MVDSERCVLVMFFVTDFYFRGCWVRYFYLHLYSKDPVSHLVGGFFLTLGHLGYLFFAPFPIQPSSTSPSVCHGTSLILPTYLLRSDFCQVTQGSEELHFFEVEWQNRTDFARPPLLSMCQNP